MKIPKPILAIALWFAGCGAAHAVTEREAVAATLVLEAGGTGQRGMEAVMWVIRNRSAIQRKTPLAIVTARRQFAVMRRGAPAAIRKAKAHPEWETALAIYDDFRHNPYRWTRTKDFTHGSLYFESFKNRAPAFFAKLTPTVRIGGNQFYTN